MSKLGMNKTELETRDKIMDMLSFHYKRTRFIYSYLEGDYLSLTTVNCSRNRYPWIAKRVLDAYPNVRAVEFVDGYIFHVYTRETLKWAGINVKEYKTKEVC